jgi:predicted ATPase
VIGDKVQHFQGKQTDLEGLESKIEDYLTSEGFKVQKSAPGDQGTVIQAKKGGFLSDVIDANRALTIMITGDPNDFTVHTGVGKWLEHLGVAAVETLLLSELFLVVDVAEVAWNVEIEEKLAKKVAALVG